MDSATKDLDQNQYLSFFIKDEEYAISILQAKEILEFEHVTLIPKMPRFVRGVINLRGKVVPVVDLGAKFGFGLSETTRWSCVVITEVEFDGETLIQGLLVDKISKVVNFEKNEIEDPPSFGADVPVDYLIGLGKVDSRFMMILDIDRVLASSEILEVSAELHKFLAEKESEGSQAESKTADDAEVKQSSSSKALGKPKAAKKSTTAARKKKAKTKPVAAKKKMARRKDKLVAGDAKAA